MEGCNAISGARNLLNEAAESEVFELQNVLLDVKDY
jgi:hypothetical protein